MPQRVAIVERWGKWPICCACALAPVSYPYTFDSGVTASEATCALSETRSGRCTLCGAPLNFCSLCLDEVGFAGALFARCVACVYGPNDVRATPNCSQQRHWVLSNHRRIPNSGGNLRSQLRTTGATGAQLARTLLQRQPTV
jgi:hypothetical protein